MTVENHGLRFEGIPNRILQENRPRSTNFRQIQSNKFQQSLLPVNRFGIFHGRLTKTVFQTVFLHANRTIHSR